MSGPREEKFLAQEGHLAYNAVLGGLYGALRHSLDDPPPIPTGPLYGPGIFAINLPGVVPALGITREPWKTEPMSTGRRMMMHALFGAVSALVQEKVLQQQPRQIRKYQHIAE